MNEQQRDQQDEYVNVPYGMPQQQRNDRADLLDKIKPEIIIELVRHKLLGETEINGSWEKVKALQGRALTEVGAWELSNLMLGVGSINTSLSKFNEQEIKKRALNISKTAIYMCTTNFREYGIVNATQLHFVNEIVFSSAFAVLKQADGASIQELIKGTVQENRLIQSEQKKPGVLRRFLG